MRAAGSPLAFGGIDEEFKLLCGGGRASWHSCNDICTSGPAWFLESSWAERSVMAYEVDFENASTLGLESSPVADALAGLRANEARFLNNKFGHVLAVESASKAQKTIDWVHRILKEERDLVIQSRPLEAAAFQVENIRIAFVFYETTDRSAASPSSVWNAYSNRASVKATAAARRIQRSSVAISVVATMRSRWAALTASPRASSTATTSAALP